MALRCNGSLLLLLCMALLPLVVCEARTVKTMARSEGMRVALGSDHELPLDPWEPLLPTRNTGSGTSGVTEPRAARQKFTQLPSVGSYGGSNTGYSQAETTTLQEAASTTQASTAVIATANSVALLASTSRASTAAVSVAASTAAFTSSTAITASTLAASTTLAVTTTADVVTTANQASSVQVTTTAASTAAASTAGTTSLTATAASSSSQSTAALDATSTAVSLTATASLSASTNAESSSTSAAATASSASTEATLASSLTLRTTATASSSVAASTSASASTASNFASTSLTAVTALSSTSSLEVSTRVVSAETSATSAVTSTFAVTAALASSSSVAATVASSASAASLSATSAVPSQAPQTSPELTGVIHVTGESPIINGSWTAPAIVVYQGDNATVRVNGSASVGGVAVIEIDDGSGSITDTQRRVLVSASGVVNGAYNRVDMKGQKRDKSAGKCFAYMAVSQEAQGSTLSVLLVPREETCKDGSSGRRWVIGGVVMGLVGGLVIVVGVMWLARDTCQRWAHFKRDDEMGLLV